MQQAKQPQIDANLRRSKRKTKDGQPQGLPLQSAYPRPEMFGHATPSSALVLHDFFASALG